MKSPAFPFNQCPVANDCLLTNGQFSPCGEASAHLQPFPLAEELCVRALAGRIRIESSATDEYGPVSAARGDSSLAWLHHESGIVVSDPVEAASHFDTSVEYANTAMHNPDTFIDSIVPAAMLHLYRPIFMARKDGIPPTRQETASLNQGLGVIFDALLAAPNHGAGQAHIRTAIENDVTHRPCVESEGQRLMLLSKVLVMRLAARKNVFLNPASIRESQGIEEFLGQNHDGYILKDRQKIPVKISAKGKSTASAQRGRVAYDERTIFINCSGLVNKALDTLRQSRPELYDSLFRKHLQQPGIVDVGRLLQSEQSGVRLDPASSAWLDIITADLMGRLGIDPNDYQQAETTAKDLPWSILPTAVLAHQKSPPEHENPKLLKAAVRAREEYLRFGNTEPSRDELRRLVGQMRQVTTPHLLVCCMGAYLDLARNSQTSPAEAVSLVDAAAALSGTFVTKDWRELPLEKTDILFRGRLLRAYMGMYRKALAGKTPDLNDLTRLYIDLIQIGRSTIEPGRATDEVRGVQFEIGIHILATRANLRRNKIVQWIRPSMPREQNPHDFSFEFRSGWDLAISRGAFLGQDTDHHFLKVMSRGNERVYSPAVTVVRGKEDLLTSNSASVIIAALRELEGTSPESSVQARRELNRYERVLMQKTIGTVG